MGLSLGLGLGLNYTRNASIGHHIYVDSVTGSDSNDGLTLATALQSVPALLAAIAAYGDGARVGIVAGSEWRDELLITNNNVLAEKVGVGADPHFRADDVIDPGDWTKTGGYTSIYQVTVPVDNSTTMSAAYWPGLWEDDARAPRVADLATLDATDTTARAYFHTATLNPTTSTITIYIKAKGGTDPASNGLTYEYSRRASGINTWQVTGCRIRGLKGSRPYQSTGGIVLGRDCIATDCVSADGNSHNILMRAGAKLRSCACVDAYAHTSQVIPIIIFESDAAGENASTENCTVVLSEANPGGLLAAYAHTTTGSFGVISHTGLSVTSAVGTVNPAGVGCANAAELVVNDLETTRCYFGVKPGVDTVVRGLHMYESPAGASIGWNDAANMSLDVDGATIEAAAGVNLGYMLRAVSNNVSLRLTNSAAVTDSGRGVLNSIYTAGRTGCSVYSHGNELRPNSGGNGYNLNADTTLDSDENTWLADGAFNVGGVGYADLAAYIAGTGQDQNSTLPA